MPCPAGAKHHCNVLSRALFLPCNIPAELENRTHMPNSHTHEREKREKMYTVQPWWFPQTTSPVHVQDLQHTQPSKPQCRSQSLLHLASPTGTLAVVSPLLVKITRSHHQFNISVSYTKTNSSLLPPVLLTSKYSVSVGAKTFETSLKSRLRWGKSCMRFARDETVNAAIEGRQEVDDMVKQQFFPIQKKNR